MRALTVLLALLAGCALPGTYPVLLPAQRSVGVAVSTRRLLTVVHPVYVGQVLYVGVRGQWVPAKVRRYDGEVVELEAVEGDLGLQPGDSGSPVALLSGRRSTR